MDCYTAEYKCLFVPKSISKTVRNRRCGAHFHFLAFFVTAMRGFTPYRKPLLTLRGVSTGLSPPWARLLMLGLFAAYIVDISKEIRCT